MSRQVSLQDTVPFGTGPVSFGGRFFGSRSGHTVLFCRESGSKQVRLIVPKDQASFVLSLLDRD